MSDLSTETLKGISWVGGASVLKVSIYTIAVMILARLITPEEFGTMALATTVVSFVSNFSRMGMDKAVIQKNQVSPQDVFSAFILCFLLGFVAAAGVFFSAPYVAKQFEIPQLNSLIRVLSILLIIQGGGYVSQAMVQRNQRFKELGIIKFCSKIGSYAVLGVILAYYGFGIWALAVAHFAFISSQMIAFIFIEPPVLANKFSLISTKKLLKYGVGQVLAGLANFLAIKGDYLVVGKWYGAGVLGLYERAYHIMAKPVTLIGESLKDVIFPIFSSIQKSNEKLRNGLIKASVLLTFIGFPLSLFVIIMSEEIVLILLGTQWKEVIPLLRIIALGTFFRINYKLYVDVIWAVGNIYIYFCVQIFYAVLICGGTIVVALMGLEIKFVAIVVLCALGINMFLLLIFSLQITKLSLVFFIKEHRPPFLLACLIFVISYLVRQVIVELNPLLNMLQVSFAVLILFVPIVKLCPDIFLGKHGKWLVQKVQRNLRSYFKISD